MEDDDDDDDDDADNYDDVQNDFHSVCKKVCDDCSRQELHSITVMTIVSNDYQGSNAEDYE